MTTESTKKVVDTFASNLLSQTEDIPPEFVQVINDEFWNLICEDCPCDVKGENNE